MTHEIHVVRRSGGAAAPGPPQWCLICGATSRMLAPEAAAALSGVSPRTIYRWVEAGRVHCAEGPDGALSVCAASLPATS